MSLESVEASVESALACGIPTEDIFKTVARVSSWAYGRSVISIKLRVIGRRTAICGMTVSQVDAVELRYVDGRWHSVSEFYSPCLSKTWANDLELFCRRRSHPILLSRYGASRDYELLVLAMHDAGIAHCFPMRGCSARSLCVNGAFPGVVTEVCSFLNVLGITPSVIEQAAKLME
jgi:hypothetical protein